MTLNLNEIVSLFVEINGDGKEFKGLLKQKLSMKVKLLIHRLNNAVKDEMKLYEDLRLELFKKYGDEQKDGHILVAPEKINDFQNEHSELLATEKQIDIATLWTTPLTINDFEQLETDEYYPTFYKLIDNEK